MLPKKLRFLASLKLAVFILVAIALISAVGTFYESLYSAEYAKLVVYQSPWMFVIQALLTVNLIAVMIDRLPWKPRHLPFLLAHIGIIFVIMGSILTYFQGVDGVMVFPLGGKNRYVEVGEKEFSVYSSFDGNRFTTLLNKDVNYFKNSPKKNTISYNISPEVDIQVVDHYLFAEAKEQILDSENKEDGPAVRFFIEGARAKESGWLLANRINPKDIISMGPANLTLYLTEPQVDKSLKNAIHFFPTKNEARVGYHLYNSSGFKEGLLKIGEILKTGWMDFDLRILSYKPHAYRGTYFEEIKYPHDLSTEAIKIKFKGKEYWLGLGQPLKVFETDRVYILMYAKKRIDIGFNLELLDFKVGRYQGSLKAASYESLVAVDGKKTLISMNEPLKKNGLTFYQSSFQEDGMGNPTHSILSVNKDPGRFLKYLGCFLVALGIILLFYFKRLGHKWRFLK